MAENTKVEVFDNDGNKVVYNLPEYAMDSTVDAMLKELRSQKDISKKSLTASEKIVKGNKERIQAQGKNSKDEIAAQNKTLDAISELTKETKANGLALAFKGAGVIGGFLATIAGATLALGGGLIKGATNLGDTLGELSKVGVGFDIDQFSSNSIRAITSLNALGMSSNQAADLMREYSGVVQGLGKQTFVELNTELAKTTGFGTKFGLTMNEMSQYLAEDLEIRQQLGFLGQIDANAQAARTAKLYDMQLKSTQVLGKSIDEIRGASKNTLATNAQVQLRFAAMTKNMNPDDIAKFQDTLRKMQGDFIAFGLDSSLSDQIASELFDVNAFSSGAGQELLQAFATVGESGSKFAGKMTSINQAIKAEDIAEASKLMAQLPSDLTAMAADMSADELRAMGAMITSIGGPLAQSLALSINELARANGRLDQVGKFPELAKSSAAFSQSLDLASGSVSAMFNTLSGALAKPMQTFTNALTQGSKDVNGNKLPSIMDSFSEAIKEVTSGFDSIFGNLDDAGSNASQFSNKLRSLAQEKLPLIAKNIVAFVKDIDFDKLIDKVKGWLDAASNINFDEIFETVGIVVSGITAFTVAIAKGIAFIGNTINDGFTNFFAPLTETSSAMVDGIKTEFTSINWSSIFTKLFVTGGLVAGVSVALIKVLGTLGFKSFGGAATDIASKGASGIGNTVGKAGAGLGAGLGKGIGGFFKGTAAGLKALGTPLALKGAGTLGIVGVAIVAAGLGFQQFSELDWDTIGKGLAGIAGLGVIAGVLGTFAPAALLGATALGAIGLSLQLFPLDKLSSFVENFRAVGAQADSIRMDAATSAAERLGTVPPEKIISLSEAIHQLTGSMTEFGDSIGSDNWFDTGVDIDKQNEQISIFSKFGSLDASGIISSSLALNTMADAYSRFASLDSDMLIKAADAMSRINNETGDNKTLSQQAFRLADQAVTTFSQKLGITGESPAPIAPQQNLVAPVQVQVNTPSENQNLGVTSSDPIADLMVALLAEQGTSNKELKRILAAIEKQA